MSVRRETSFHVSSPPMQALEISHAALVMMGALIQQVDPYNGIIQAVMGVSLVSYGEMLMVSIRPAATGADVWIVSQSAQPTAIFDWGKNDQNLLAFSNVFRQIGLQYMLFPETAPVTPPTETEAPAQKLDYDPFSTDEFHKLPQEMPPAPAPEKPPAQAKSKHRVFISYRRSDSNDVCGRLYDRLERELKAENVFKDVDNIPYGVDFVEYLDQQVKQCTCLLAVIGPTWVSAADDSGNRRLHDPNDFVRIEIELALKRNIVVVPVLVKGAVMPSTGDLPESLQPLVRRNGISLRNDPDFHGDITRLISRLG